MYKDPGRQKAYDKSRYESRLAYWREYRRSHPQPYKYQYKGRNSMAYKGEEIALKVLQGSERINRPCDINWNGKLVDVKTSKPIPVRNTSFRWKFLLSQKGKIDLFLLIREDKEGRVIDIHLIPDKEIRHKNLSVNNKTVLKYSKYLLSL